MGTKLMEGTQRFNPQVLAEAVHGDLGAFAIVQKQSHKDIQQARKSLRELVVTTTDLRRVLNALLHNEASLEQAHLWAFFVSHGYVGHWESQPITEQDQLPPRLQGHQIVTRHQAMPSGHTSGPIRAIDIDWDLATEDKIADVMARLDDIGTGFDGEVTLDEVARMLDDLADNLAEDPN